MIQFWIHLAYLSLERNLEIMLIVQYYMVIWEHQISFTSHLCKDCPYCTRCRNTLQFVFFHVHSNQYKYSFLPLTIQR